MQATRERKATRNAVRITSALAIATWLGAGCGKTEKPEPAAPEASRPVQAETSVEAETWEPETVTPPKAPSDHGHDGHDHGPDGHSH